MAQHADISNEPATDRAPLGRWSTLRLVARAAAQPVAAGPTNRWSDDEPRLLDEQRDPGLLWVSSVPVERASAELTMRDLLSTWRAAERCLEDMTEDDEESSYIKGQIDALRVAYQRLFAQIRVELPTGWTRAG